MLPSTGKQWKHLPTQYIESYGKHLENTSCVFLKLKCLKKCWKSDLFIFRQIKQNSNLWLHLLSIIGMQAQMYFVNVNVLLVYFLRAHQAKQLTNCNSTVKSHLFTRQIKGRMIDWWLQTSCCCVPSHNQTDLSLLMATRLSSCSLNHQCWKQN